MSKDFEVGIKLVGDGKGLVGEVRAAKEALNGLGETAKRTNTESAAAAEKFTASLKRQADTLGMTASQTRAYEASQLQLNSAQRASVEASNKAIAAGESHQRVMERLRFAAMGLAAAVGTVLVMALKSSVTQAAQAEQSQLRMQAVLTATGHAAGLTKGELDALAGSGKMRFGIDDDAMRDSIAVLLTFKNVSRDSFGKALEGAADLAAVMQTDLKSAVLQLGKALENPDEGLGALKRSGVSFSESQKTVIKDLVETGRQGEALTLVLKVLNEQVGGVAASMNQGMTKATRDAGLAWDDLLKALGKTGVAKDTVEGVFGGITATLTGLKNLIENGDWLDRLAFSVSGLPGIPGMVGRAGMALARGRSTPATSAASNGNASAQASADALAGLTRQQLAQDAEIKYLAQQKLSEEAAKKREEAGKRAAQATAQAIEGSQRYAAAIKLETEQVGLNAVQKRMMSAAAEAAKAPTTALKEEIMASAQAWAEATDAQQAVIDAEKSRLQTIEVITKAEQDAARARQAELDRIGNSFERTGETAFVLFASHGFKALGAIVEAGKLAAIKLAYELTARPIILKMIASITGVMGASAANAAGGGAMDTLFNAAGAMNAGKMLWTGFSGGIASGLGSIVGGIGSMIGSSALAAFGGGLAATGTGAAAITGASAFLAAGGSGAAAVGGSAAMASMGVAFAELAGPLAAVAAIGTLLYMGFKKKTTQIGQGIQGDFGTAGFTGADYQQMRVKSFFTKAKYPVNTSPLDDQTTARMSQAMALLRSSTTEYANVLGLPVDAIAGYTKHIIVALTGDAAKDKAAIDDMFLGIADSLANLTGNFYKFIQAGETSATTLRRLATEFASVDSVLHSTGMTFGAVGFASMEARERLINLTGGLDALAQKTAFYAQNFLSEAERLAPVQADVTAAMAALGYAGITSKKELADVIRGLNLTTEAGAKTYAALTTLAPAFATVADAEIAHYKTVVGATFQALQRAVDAERTSVQKHIDEITGSISKLTSLSGSLHATLGRMNVAGNAGAERAQAQAQIAGALAIARASGVLPSAESLAGALDVVAQPSEQLFGSFVEYMQDFARTAADITSLDGLTQGQLTIKQQALSTAQGQLSALDGILASAQAQIDAINGVNTSVMSVAAALAGMRSAFGGPGATAAAALGATTSGLGGTPSDAAFVTGLYNTLLGRAPDAVGLAGWEAQLAAGKTANDVIEGFTGSQEYMARVPKFADGGDHTGGLAIVGDGGGPELINMAPGRVYSNSASQKMLDFSAVVAKLDELQKELAKIAAASNRGADGSQKAAATLVRVTRDGESLVTTPA